MRRLELRRASRHIVASALVIGATLLISGATQVVQSAHLPAVLNTNSNTSDNNFDDGYDELPPGLQGFSYSVLVMSGVDVHLPRIRLPTLLSCGTLGLPQSLLCS